MNAKACNRYAAASWFFIGTPRITARAPFYQGGSKGNIILITGGFMKLCRCFGIILALACLQGVSAQVFPDTMWACRDSIPEGDLQFYFQIGLCDTFVNNQGCWNSTLNSPGVITMADTGDKWDSSYINFNYQFNNDSVHLKGKNPLSGNDTTYHYGPRPGYAGFKIFWDNGFVAFNANSYDSLYFVYKGPLPGHKVHMIWGQGGQCGGPILYQYFGEFTSCTTWTKATFPFPEKSGNFPQNPNPDSPFVKVGLFELRMLIYNDSTITTSPTSAPGNLKIDDMGFIRKSTAVRNPMHLPKAADNTRSFVPKVSGKVTLAVYSLQGEELFKGLVDVAAGKRYDVSRFVRNNSNLPTQWIHCVQITGSGVNITGKVCR
jgi:hypothetical protein